MIGMTRSMSRLAKEAANRRLHARWRVNGVSELPPRIARRSMAAAVRSNDLAERRGHFVPHPERAVVAMTVSASLPVRSPFSTYALTTSTTEDTY